MTWLRNGQFKRKTESLLYQYKMTQWKPIKSKREYVRLCGDRDKTINLIITECCKLAQTEYKTRHDWVGKVIHWELCKKLKFDHTNKWYIHNSAAVLENDTQTPTGLRHTNGSPNLTRKTNIQQKQKKRNCKIVDFPLPVAHRIKLKES